MSCKPKPHKKGSYAYFRHKAGEAWRDKKMALARFLEAKAVKVYEKERSEKRPRFAAGAVSDNYSYGA